MKRLRPLLAVAAGAALVMAEAWLRRGSPFTSGLEGNRGVTTIMPYSGRPGFSYPFLLGVASILFSFGRGLLFFTPGLFLALGPRTRRLVPAKRVATLQVAFVAGLVIVYAKWWAWYGGLGWGPRYFIFAAVPASLFLATRLHAEDDTIGGHAITLLVLTLSCWVGFTAALGDLQRQTFCAAQNYQSEALCWYTPGYSGLWWPVLHHTLPRRRCSSPATSSSYSATSQRRLRSRSDEGSRRDALAGSKAGGSDGCPGPTAPRYRTRPA